MQPDITGLPAWQTTISDCTTKLEKLTKMQMPYQGYPGPGCVPDNSGTQLKVTAASLQVVQEAALEGTASPIEAYSYDLHILDAVQDSQQITCMT